MASYTKSVITPWTVDAAFGYVADARNFPEWDPGIIAVHQTRGSSVESGAAYRVDARMGPRVVPLPYSVRAIDRPSHLLLEGRTRMLDLHDEISVAPSDHGTCVTYRAHADLRGGWRLLEPLWTMAFRRSSARGASRLRRRLQQPR